MPPLDTRAVALSYFEELTNKRNLDFIETLFDPQIAFHDPAIVPTGEAHGYDAVRHFFSVFFTAFPDLHFNIDDFFVEDDKAAIRFTWTGTHRATFLGVTVTEHHVSVPGIDIFHIANGKITEVQVAFDRLNLIQQLGGITRPI